MSGYEYLQRPYPYAREPFLVASGEKVAFEGRLFSIPAFAAQLDKRLFTALASHPVANIFKLYINRTSNTTISQEPTINASGYERGTPHYADVILDIRSTLSAAFTGHAADSDHTAQDFKVAHLDRQHTPYNLPTSSRPDVIPGDYVHKNPVGLTPSGDELGAKYWQDIDMDELQWQPFARPKKLATLTNNNVPFEPIFPMALNLDGSLPTMSTLDDQKYGQLALGASASGGVLITGDGLLDGTSFKLLPGSGVAASGEGLFQEMVPWALYPCGTGLNRYYETVANGTISVSGRKSIYNTTIPSTTIPNTQGVMLLDVADVGISGYNVQHWPANYYAPSGVDRNGKAHNGVHILNRLIYDITAGAPGNLLAGRSIINGKRIFGHFVGTETNSQGKGYNQATKYANGDIIYGFGGILVPRVGDSSIVSWFSTNKTFSPVAWTTFSTTVYVPTRGVFGAPDSTNYTLGDINASTNRIVTRKLYNQWGTIDQLVVPDNDMATGGSKISDTITYVTHIYREGTDPTTGLFAWVELPPPQSPITTTQALQYYRNTYHVNNIFSFFFLQKPNYGFVHVNGDIAIQWSDRIGGIPVKPICNRFSVIGAATTKLVPPTARSESTYTVGSFPSWQIRLAVTTNNQFVVPDTISVSSAFTAISFATGIPMTTSRVDTFGPAVWDPSEGVNYIYFKTVDAVPRFYFAKMDTSFVINYINEVDSADVILSGRSAIISI